MNIMAFLGFRFQRRVILKPINQKFKIGTILICYMLSYLFGKYVQRCINFRFYIWSDNSFMITSFRGNFQGVSKKFDAESLGKI